MPPVARFARPRRLRAGGDVPAEEPGVDGVGEHLVERRVDVADRLRAQRASARLSPGARLA